MISSVLLANLIVLYEAFFKEVYIYCNGLLVAMYNYFKKGT